jgi:hypothetical protein
VRAIVIPGQAKYASIFNVGDPVAHGRGSLAQYVPNDSTFLPQTLNITAIAHWHAACVTLQMRFLPISGPILLLLVNCSSGNREGDASVGGGDGSFSGTGGQTTGGTSSSGGSAGSITAGAAGSSSDGSAFDVSGGQTNEGGAESGGSSGKSAGGAPTGGAVGSAGAAGGAGTPGGISCGQTTCGPNQHCRAGCCGTPNCNPGPDTCWPMPVTCNGVPSCGCICGQSSSFFCKDGGVIQCGCA